jgi:hypothetical protein
VALGQARTTAVPALNYVKHLNRSAETFRRKVANRFGFERALNCSAHLVIN